ncbi:uncharacterized protein LOC122093685 [Macadamia integrifolia]|uniref:uncharacterized protein LOC122093685 n=1 Tax=Macadamia integrifolia TaxID=60698 RepID=UPI001C52F8FD|nr:uncharacterized protein LOC122093685 [Macadamia integrifolia]
MNKLRNDYGSFKKLMETSGFGWNPVTKTCTVEDDGVWERHIKMIFGDSYACGDGDVGNAEDHVTFGEDDDLEVDPSLGAGGLASPEVGDVKGSIPTNTHSLIRPLMPLGRGGGLRILQGP